MRGTMRRGVTRTCPATSGRRLTKATLSPLGDSRKTCSAAIGKRANVCAATFGFAAAPASASARYAAASSAIVAGVRSLRSWSASSGSFTCAGSEAAAAAVGAHPSIASKTWSLTAKSPTSRGTTWACRCGSLAVPSLSSRLEAPAACVPSTAACARRAVRHRSSHSASLSSGARPTGRSGATTQWPGTMGCSPLKATLHGELKVISHPLRRRGGGAQQAGVPDVPRGAKGQRAHARRRAKREGRAARSVQERRSHWGVADHAAQGTAAAGGGGGGAAGGEAVRSAHKFGALLCISFSSARCLSFELR
eukprot:scaffold25696_cov66-Phaeocystis_antarctica.AAC.10